MAAESSIKGLTERISENLTSLIYGQNSFGAWLENEQLSINGEAESISAIPSPTNQIPRNSKDKDYFAATLSPSINGHLDRVDVAIQVEIHKRYRNGDEYQEEYEKAFGNALINFYAKYFGEHLKLFM